MNRIIVDNISKQFKVYANPFDRVKELVSFKKKHRIFEAVRNVSFSVSDGTCVGLVGLNGSGKSTILKLIAGVLYPNSGNIKVQGRVAALLELGAGFNEEFTGIDNVKFQCSLLGIPKDQWDSIIVEVAEFSKSVIFFTNLLKVIHQECLSVLPSQRR